MTLDPKLKAKILRQFKAGADMDMVAANCLLPRDWIEEVIRQRLKEQGKTEESNA